MRSVVVIGFFISVLSAIVGFLGSLLGVGGGAFLMPALVLGLGISPHDAMPISLACALATGLSGAILSGISYQVLQRILIFEPSALIGTLVFAPMAHALHGRYILYLFSIFLVAIAILSRSFERRTPSPVPNAISETKKNWFGIISTLVSGACVGLFGIGGGILLVPLLRKFSQLSMKEAVQISLCIMISTSTIGLLVHASFAPLPWRLCMLGVLGALPAGMIGGVARKKIPDGKLSKMFLLFVLAMAAITLIKAWVYIEQ